MLPIQLRMARVALGLSVREAANVAGVAHNTISRLEAGMKQKASTVQKVREALERAGVIFIPENGGGVGVRLKDRSETRDD